MAIKLNLLPPEYSTTKGLGSILKATRALGIISIGVFIAFTIGVSAFYLISNITLNGLNSDIDSLKGQIGSLEKSEQQIILLKDRLAKVKTVLGVASASDVVTGVDPYVSNIPGGTLDELGVDATSANFSITFTSNKDLANFLTKLSTSTNFKNITMTSFTYGPSSGYKVDFKASKK